MIDFLDESVWTRIGNCAAKAQRKRAAIAYVTEDQPLALGDGDVLVTNASDYTIASGSTSPAVLRKLFERGVSLFSFPALHAKVVVLDGTVIVSSANLSLNSQHTLYEAGIETDNPNVRSQAIAFIQSAIRQSEPITEEFLNRIDKIPVAKRQNPELEDRYSLEPAETVRPTTWLVGIYGINQPTDPDEMRLVTTGTESANQVLSNPESSPVWVRYARHLRIAKQAVAGDNLIVIWRDTEKSDPKRVYRHAPVLLNQAGPRNNRIFYEELPQAEEETLTWIQFQGLLKRLGIREASKDSTRELTVEQSNQIHELWETARG